MKYNSNTYFEYLFGLNSKNKFTSPFKEEKRISLDKFII